MVTHENLDLVFQVRALAGQFKSLETVYERFTNNHFGSWEGSADEIRYSESSSSGLWPAHD